MNNNITVPIEKEAFERLGWRVWDWSPSRVILVSPHLDVYRITEFKPEDWRVYYWYLPDFFEDVKNITSIDKWNEWRWTEPEVYKIYNDEVMGIRHPNAVFEKRFKTKDDALSWVYQDMQRPIVEENKTVKETNWKKVSEEFNQYPEDVKAKFKTLFETKDPAKLNELVEKNPDALKVYELATGRIWVKPPEVPVEKVVIPLVISPIEKPQQVIARILKFDTYTGSRPDWQHLLRNAVNGDYETRKDCHDMMKATATLLGYNLNPPSNVSMERHLAQQLADETGKPVLIIKGSSTIEPKLKKKEPWQLPPEDIEEEKQKLKEFQYKVTELKERIKTYQLGNKEVRLTQSEYRRTEGEIKSLADEVEKIGREIIVVEAKIAREQADEKVEFSARERYIVENIKTYKQLQKECTALLLELTDLYEELKNKYVESFYDEPDKVIAEFLGTTPEDVKDRKEYLKTVTAYLKEKPPAKEPWMMTYREFFDIAGSEYTAGERFGVPTKNRMPINPETGYPIKGATPEERIHRAVLMKALKEGKPVPEEILKDYPDLIKKPIPFDWGHFIKEFKVKHYVGYRTETAYGIGGRDLRSVVKYEIEELENTDIIDWTGVSDYIALIDALYAHGYTEAVWLCKDKQHVIDYYCDGDPTCPIEKYEITDGLILSDLGEDGQLVAYQPEKVKIEEPDALSLSELKQKYLAIGWHQFVDDVFKGKRKIEPCVEYVDLPHLLVHKITVGPAEEVKYGAMWDVKSYDKEGNILVSKGFKTERDAFIDFHSYIRDLIKQEQAKEEIPEEAERPPEKVKIHGVLKTRYRCPICYRAAPEGFCMVHSDVEPIDLLTADESVKEAAIDLTFLDLFKTKQPEKKRWTIEELHDAIGIDIDYAPEFLTKQRPPETYAEYYTHEFNVVIEGIKPPVVPEEVKPPVEKRTEIQENVFEYFKKEIGETDVEAYQRGYLDALHREIGREFIVDHLLLADSEELYRLMDLKRGELEAELKRRVVPIPPSVEELVEKEKLEILRKVRKYKKVKAEVPELKIGAEVTLNDKKGVLVDVSANKYRVNWDDGTWNWITQKDFEIVIVY